SAYNGATAGKQGMPLARVAPWLSRWKMPPSLFRRSVDIDWGLRRRRGRPGDRRHLSEPRFERRDAGLERLVFFSCKARHVFDGFEFLPLDHIQIAQKAFGLVSEQRLELAAHALRHAGGVIHQPGNFVEEPIRRLNHARLRSLLSLANPGLSCPQTMA